MPREYVNANCTGATDASRDAIILSIYGPRGGTAACVGMTQQQAEELRDALLRVLPITAQVQA